ncbi:MAG: GerAB/ArcD/ProY family transporter [Clostridia bacterium]|nr:GerAB/ArcD/ProY family transporter [Clostridia bacterium]
MNEFSSSQIFRFFVAFSPMAKLIFLPALLAERVKNDLWISIAICFLLDGFLLLSVLFLARRGADISTLLLGAFGRVGSKILCLVYALFFFVKSFLFFGEEGRFVTVELYETVPLFIFLLPLIFVGFYLSQKRARTLGRLADIFFFITLFSFGALLLFALPSANFQALLPVAFRNGTAIFRGAFTSLLYFGDPLFLFFLLGKFHPKSKETGKIFFGFLLSAVITVGFCALFYSVFTVLAPFETASYYNLGKYGAFSTSSGRIDLMITYLLRSVTAIAISLPGFFAVRFLRAVTGAKTAWICGLIFYGALAICLFFGYPYLAAISKFLRRYGGYFALLLQYLIPLYAGAVFLIKRHEKRPFPRGEMQKKGV